jgi:hypothetical protein
VPKTQVAVKDFGKSYYSQDGYCKILTDFVVINELIILTSQLLTVLGVEFVGYSLAPRF